MTKIYNKSIKKKIGDLFYRSAIVVYIIYFILSPQALAQEAQAPDEAFAHLLAMVEPLSFNSEETTTITDKRALKIEAYYNRHNLPLADYAESFVEAADRYDIDWRLLAAIGFIESTGGKFSCSTADYSPFGWGSCKIDFDSYEDAIDVVSMNLGGHNPSTEYFYKDKNLTEVLYAYNSVIPTYKAKILREMNTIELQNV
jgi:hypothetical protein